MNIINTPDFRKELYKKYVSTFKKFISNENESIRKTYFKWYRRTYLKEISHLPKSSAIIDIGCGSGIMLEFLKEEGFDNLYGIDISEQQIEIAKNRGLQVEALDFFSLLKSNSKKFDIVFAMDIIEHLYKEELFDFFIGVDKLLNENGLFFIHTPNGDGLFPNHIIYGDLTHLTIFNSNSLGQILRLSGFNSLRFRETGPSAKDFIGLIRFVLWKCIKLVYNSIRIIETGGTEKIITQDFICIAKKEKTNRI